ncbi:MAG: hypothetical protein ACPGTU_07740 [Myxococcota bacterium]
MTLLRFCLFAVLTACAPEKTSADTSDPLTLPEDEPEEETEACVVSVRVETVPVEELPDPVVGDSWYLLMYCDETLMLGASVLRIEPSHLGTLDPEDPIITFVSAGVGEIQYQIGSTQVKIPVTIQE